MVSRSAYLNYYRNYFEHFYEPRDITSPANGGTKFIVKMTIELEITASPSEHNRVVDESFIEKIALDNVPYIDNCSRGVENYDIRSRKSTVSVDAIRRYGNGLCENFP